MELIEFTDAESNMVDLMGEYAQYQELPAGSDTNGEDQGEEEEEVVVEKKNKSKKPSPGSTLPGASTKGGAGAARATVNGKEYEKPTTSGRVREDESGNKASKIPKVNIVVVQKKNLKR
jgi:hypothetical protein